MRTGERFSKVLQDELGCRAVWPPIITPIQLGDYGVLDGGVFQRLGHVSDFGADIEVVHGQPTSLNFVSASAGVQRIAGDVPVDSFAGLGGVQARLAIEFAESSSFLLKCGRVTIAQIGNIGALGRELAGARSLDGRTWNTLSWRIVWQLYTGRDVVFLATRSAGTRVDFVGQVGAIRQLDLGNYSAGVHMQASRSLGVEILGRTGPVGLGLAKVRLFTASIGFLSSGDPAEPDSVEVDTTPDDPAEIFAADPQTAEVAAAVDDDEPQFALMFGLADDASEPGPDDDAEPPADWDDVEAILTDPAEIPQDALAFAGPVDVDSSSRERWLQSCLRALVAPDLVVDGQLGVGSRRALKTFQRDAGLTADGVPGPRTIAALEARSQTTCPKGQQDAPAPASTPTPSSTAPASTSAPTLAASASTPAGPRPASTATPTAAAPRQAPTATPTAAASAPAAPWPASSAGGPPPSLTVREAPAGPGKREVRVAGGGDEITFTYWSDPRGDEWNVSSYHGGKTGLVTDADLRAIGATTGAIKILRANAKKESGGKFGAINTWDDQLVSWGAAQFAGRAGTLAVLLASMKDDPLIAPAYARWFAGQGMRVAHGRYQARKKGQQAELTGWHLEVDTPDGLRTGDAAWMYVRTQPRLIGAMMLAGNDPTIQLGQIKFWLEHFLATAIHKTVTRTPTRTAKVCDYLRSEYALGLIARLYNWMPAYVQSWFNELTAELARTRAGVDVRDPAAWQADHSLETAFCELMKAKRKAVKKGSYDTYGLDLDRSPGSFFAAVKAAV